MLVLWRSRSAGIQENLRKHTTLFKNMFRQFFLHTKYKVEFKVYNKMFMGQSNTGDGVMYAVIRKVKFNMRKLMINCGLPRMWIAPLLLSLRVVEA